MLTTLSRLILRAPSIARIVANGTLSALRTLSTAATEPARPFKLTMPDMLHIIQDPEFRQILRNNPQPFSKLTLRTEDGSDTGQNLLHVAVKIGSPELVRMLLECGYDLSKKNNDGKTALDCAREEVLRPDLSSNKKTSFNTIVEMLEYATKHPVIDYFRKGVERGQLFSFVDTLLSEREKAPSPDIPERR